MGNSAVSWRLVGRAGGKWYSALGGGGEAGARSPLSADSAREGLQGRGRQNINRQTETRRPSTAIRKKPSEDTLRSPVQTNDP